MFKREKSSKENSDKDVKEDKQSKDARGDPKFQGHKCKYCDYLTAQQWILEKHVSSVHYKTCVCPMKCCSRNCARFNCLSSWF